MTSRSLGWRHAHVCLGVSVLGVRKLRNRDFRVKNLYFSLQALRGMETRTKSRGGRTFAEGRIQSFSNPQWSCCQQKGKRYKAWTGFLPDLQPYEDRLLQLSDSY
ncbi:MAG: hypothetical protein GY696_06730, partial [Gammaproteobacteria bacterium]|nr:hypothetical protein [Gammaproteobacteria bacterium]